MDTAPQLRLQIDRKALLLAGEFAVSAIVERTARGEDADGRPFKPYSTRALALPAGAVPKRVQARLRRAENGLYYFKSRKTGKLWFVVEGGYAAIKRAQTGKENPVPDLWGTGSMMRALRVLGVEQGASGGGVVTVGFSRPEEAQRAYWNSRTRRFIGLTADEQAEVGQIVGGGVSVDVR